MIDYVTIPEDRMKVLEEHRLEYSRKLRNFLDVKFWTGDSVEIEGDDAMAVLRAKEVVKAFGRGFDWADAMDMADEDFVLEILDASAFGKSKNRQTELKGRVIGAEGRSKKLIEKYSGAKIAVYGKTVSIIGRWDSVSLARKAVEALLSGAKHTGVFKMLEERKIV